MKLVYKYMTIFFNFSPKSNHVHSLQVKNCDSNSRLVVDEDDNGKFRLQRVKPPDTMWSVKQQIKAITGAIQFLKRGSGGGGFRTP